MVLSDMFLWFLFCVVCLFDVIMLWFIVSELLYIYIFDDI